MRSQLWHFGTTSELIYVQMTAGHEERLWMPILDPHFLLLYLPPSPPFLSSLVFLWQTLGILGNRLVYSTFHHISC